MNNLSDEFFDALILEADLKVETDGLPQEALNRMGDVKAALIGFSRRPEFKEDIEAALEKKFGKPKRPDSQEEWVTFQDRFVLEHRLNNDDTVLERFVEHYEDNMGDDVRDLILGWRHVIESMIEGQDGSDNRLKMRSRVNSL